MKLLAYILIAVWLLGAFIFLASLAAHRWARRQGLYFHTAPDGRRVLSSEVHRS